jgi:pimeloyl-ACP methyl ester carboxylesterase
VLKFEDLSNVILLGHSYGGMVITGVAERVPERLSQLIYLDADVPADGQNMYALETPQDSASYKEFVRTKGEGWWWMPPVEGLSDFSRPRAVRQPIKTFEQPIQINNPEATKVPRTFILCTIGRGGQQGADRALSEPSWRYRELNANHGANAVSKPSDLVNMLLDLI